MLFRLNAAYTGWLASYQDKWADILEEAFRMFSAQFYKFVDRTAFIGQCHTTADPETFFISKPDDSRFFYRYVTY